MAHEPSAFVLDFQNAVQLVAADALFGRAQQMHGLHPLVQRNVAALEDRAHAHRELLPACAALFQTVANKAIRVFRAGLRANAIENVNTVRVAAVRAHRAVRPKDAFELRESRRFVIKVGLIQNRHGRIPVSL